MLLLLATLNTRVNRRQTCRPVSPVIHSASTTQVVCAKIKRNNKIKVTKKKQQVGARFASVVSPLARKGQAGKFKPIKDTYKKPKCAKICVCVFACVHRLSACFYVCAFICIVCAAINKQNLGNCVKFHLLFKQLVAHTTCARCLCVVRLHRNAAAAATRRMRLQIFVPSQRRTAQFYTLIAAATVTVTATVTATATVTVTLAAASTSA